MTLLSSLAIAVVFMAVLGLMLALVLSLANKRLFVYEDPSIDQVEELLPHTNCGACGTAGCRAFAEKLVAGELQPAQCTVNTKEMNQVIADFLGVDLGQQVKRVARLASTVGTSSRIARTSPFSSLITSWPSPETATGTTSGYFSFRNWYW